MLEDRMALTVKETVRVTGLTRSRLYRLFAEGKLHPRSAGRQTIILADDLRAYLDSLPPTRAARRRNQERC